MGPSAAAREGDRGTKIKGGGGDQKSNTGKIPLRTPRYTPTSRKENMSEKVGFYAQSMTIYTYNVNYHNNINTLLTYQKNICIPLLRFGFRTDQPGCGRFPSFLCVGGFSVFIFG